MNTKFYVARLQGSGWVRVSNNYNSIGSACENAQDIFGLTDTQCQTLWDNLILRLLFPEIILEIQFVEEKNHESK